MNELRRRWTRSKRGLKPEPMKALPAEIPLLAANGNVHDRSAQRYVPEKEEYIDPRACRNSRVTEEMRLARTIMTLWGLAAD